MLKIKNLTYEYSKFTLESVSVDLEASYVLGIFGANGAGKSTLIKLLAFELARQEGKVLLNDTLDYRSTMAYAPSYFPFNIKQNISELEKMLSLFYDDWDSDRFDKYCKVYGLEKSDKLKSLSYGKKKRLVMSITMSHKANLLILDEALAGIDPFIKTQILDDLRDYIYKFKPIVIIASHNLEELESLVDHVIYLENGKAIVNADILKFREKANSLLKTKLDNVTIAKFAVQRQQEQKDAKN